MTSILIEGWRFTPNSFAIVNQFQCLELMRREGIEIFHKDVPFWKGGMKPAYGMLPPDIEAQLRLIPPPVRKQAFDATLRMGCPFDFSPSDSRRTTVFATCEFGLVSEQAVSGNMSFGDAVAGSSAMLITPSNWSREGLINSGADHERITVIPHGVDTDIYHPLPSSERESLRRKLGWEGAFVFLNVSAMTPNKGIPVLLRAMVDVAQRYACARLVLKGLDSWYKSDRHVEADTRRLSGLELETLRKRTAYIGATRSFAEMAAFYQAADAYVAPYCGEGFNMPVLEAMACGLPVICTKGGATDDFTNSDFSLAIDSTLNKTPADNGRDQYFLVPDQLHLIELMSRVMEDHGWRVQVRHKGPDFVRSGYTWGHVVDRLLPIVTGWTGR